MMQEAYESLCTEKICARNRLLCHFAAHPN